ncbi:hypothetical protein [uncultured Sphingobacterium sp.]|uniref:hypothetical protein n=1 Tax=uncultured Sphingobacterium sp. TaxID=182688 RepID=UPI0025E97888|nr:hypothetical protein [uncultured Sphingobacterium sp.]
MLTKRNSWLRAGTLALLGLGLAYGAQSFTEKEEVKVELKADFVEWKYEGTSNNLSQALDADNYSPAGSTSCGGTPQTICRISAPEDLSNPGHPDMSAAVGSSTVGADIQNSVSNPTPTINNTVKSLRSF